MSDSVGSVSVDVVPDARGWSEKLRAQLRDQTVKIQADADTTEANAQLDEAARTRTAKIKADVSQFSQGASKLDQFVGNLRLLPALAIVAVPALIPLAGVLGGIAAALAAPLVIAGGGATLFAFMAGFAVKDTNTQLKAIDATSKKLAGLTKGTKEYAATQQLLIDQQKALSPQQRQFANAKAGLSSAFGDFIGGKAGVALLGPLTQGMKLLAQILPSLTPVLVAAGGAFSTLLGDLGKAASGPGFDKFIKLVSGQVAHDILGFGHVLGNIASGLGGLFVQLDKKAGGNMVDQLVKLSGAFSDWANSDKGRKAIQSFLNYAHDNGPQAAHTLGAIARSIGHIVEALAPLGPPTLRVVQGVADALSGIPIPVLTALAGAFVGLVGFQKVGGFKALGAIGKLGALSGKGGILGSLASKAGVVPVFVTNEGFGGPGGGGPGGGGFWSKAGKWAGPAGAGGAEAATAGLGTVAAAAAALAVPIVIAGYAQRNIFPYGRDHAADPGTARGGQYAQQHYGVAPGPAEGRHQPGSSALSRGFAPVAQYAPALTSVGTAADAVRARIAAVSRSFDTIGPHAQGAAGQASRSLGALQTRLFALEHPVKFQIIANTASAIQSLERLQAMTIRDKSFNVIQNNIERTVGPGGGMQRHARGGWALGAGTGTSDSITSKLSNGEFVVNARSAAQNRALLEQINSGRAPSYAPSSSAHSGPGFGGPVNLVLDDGTTLRAHFEGIADGVYQANGAYESARAGA